MDTRKLLRMCFMSFVFAISSSFSLIPNQSNSQPGNVTYSYEGGQIQCLSQQDETGHITILLKSLNSHTTAKFSNIYLHEKQHMLKVLMLIAAETDLCASWTTFHEVHIPIEPIQKKSITLEGKLAHKQTGFTVLLQ